MLLDVKKLSFAYRSDVPVLRDISLSVQAGRVTVLIGPNGSGKSTLLRALMGQLAIASGEVLWDGRPVARWRPRELARLVAYLPQSPVHEAGWTVGEILRAGRTPYLQAFGVESEKDVEVIRQTAGMLELEDLLHRPMEELSGGQRQRVFLGRALAQEPQALLLDEPSTFLDLKHQVELWRRLKELAEKRGMAILAASHDLQLSAAFADELILLDRGAIAASGAAAAVLRPEALSAVYGLPMECIDRANRPPLIAPKLG